MQGSNCNAPATLRSHAAPTLGEEGLRRVFRVGLGLEVHSSSLARVEPELLYNLIRDTFFASSKEPRTSVGQGRKFPASTGIPRL